MGLALSSRVQRGRLAEQCRAGEDHRGGDWPARAVVAPTLARAVGGQQGGKVTRSVMAHGVGGATTGQVDLADAASRVVTPVLLRTRRLDRWFRYSDAVLATACLGTGEGWYSARYFQSCSNA